jgi:hypothetical protein
MQPEAGANEFGLLSRIGSAGRAHLEKKAIFRIWLVDAGSPVIWAMPARPTVR